MVEYVNKSTSELWQNYLEKGFSIKLKILAQIVGEFFDNNSKFPNELHITIHPHENSGLIRDLSKEVLSDLGSSEISMYEFSRIESFNPNFIDVVFKKA